MPRDVERNRRVLSAYPWHIRVLKGWIVQWGGSDPEPLPLLSRKHMQRLLEIMLVAKGSEKRPGKAGSDGKKGPTQGERSKSASKAAMRMSCLNRTLF